MSHVLRVRSGWLKKCNFVRISLQRNSSFERFGTGMTGGVHLAHACIIHTSVLIVVILEQVCVSRGGVVHGRFQSEEMNCFEPWDSIRIATDRKCT